MDICSLHRMLFQIPQRYRFSSKSQHSPKDNSNRRRCFRYHKGTDFQANHNILVNRIFLNSVVLDTTKVQIFKQITTDSVCLVRTPTLFQIPQRYRFSSKSQRYPIDSPNAPVVLDTTKVQIFKQITTAFASVITFERLFQIPQRYRFSSKSQPLLLLISICIGCFRYHKGTDFQANHNRNGFDLSSRRVVLDTTKVQIFKQITTPSKKVRQDITLFQIPQRYRFSSKSQQLDNMLAAGVRCFRYHKGTDFQANHNTIGIPRRIASVVLDTTKVQIFKQITTSYKSLWQWFELFQIPQRYRFSSKSQLNLRSVTYLLSCFRYHKGTDFQANHNTLVVIIKSKEVVLDTTKVQIFKQITTLYSEYNESSSLFQIPQRYRFSSKSQQIICVSSMLPSCFRYHKGTDFQANHNALLRRNNYHQLFQIPQRYRFSSKSQRACVRMLAYAVVLDTTKVQIFKQITTSQHR